MISNVEKFALFSTILRFLPYKITPNLKRIYLDFEIQKLKLTAYYENYPSELEIELLDDIVTNSNAHIPDFFIYVQTKLFKEKSNDDKHEFTVFATYE